MTLFAEPLSSRYRGSSMTVRNRPAVKSDSGLTAALFRSIDLGVNTTSGRRTPSRACRRSRWK